MSEHSPGPWRAASAWPEHNSVVNIETDAVSVKCAHPRYGNETVVAVCGRDNGDENAPERWANARLIAAAPDLLAACKLALDDLQWGEVEDALRAAVAKAEGSAA